MRRASIAAMLAALFGCTPVFAQFGGIVSQLLTLYAPLVYLYLDRSIDLLSRLRHDGRSHHQVETTPRPAE
jgi:hypothetical protein